MERVSLCVRISSKLPLCDSRIGDNVKKRGWSLGWVLSGATRVSKEKFSFLSGLEIQPKQTRRFIELSVMKMNPLLLVVIPLLVLSGPYVNAGPVGDFFKKVGHSISKPLQSQPPPPPQSTRPQPANTPHATRRPTSRAAPAAAATPPASRTTITPSQRRRAYWHCAACFSRGYRKSKSWFALWNSGPRPERHGHESLSAGRGQVYRCHRFCVRVRRERSIHRKVFSGSVG